MKKLILSAIFCFAFTFNSFAQAREITQNEYYRHFREANNKPPERMRVTTKEEFYDNDGKLISVKNTVIEYFNSETLRQVETRKSKKKIETSELIQIGTVYYCRENKGAWKKSENWCGGMGLSALPEAISSKITVEATKFKTKQLPCINSI